ncbi:MAG: hypothetical protein EGQ99_01865 [Porphyromonadaceae bacterium]|nr:hypothetical protein [Porphyromonadaceae bacterium]
MLIFLFCLFRSAKIVQIECKTANLFARFAKMPPILSKIVQADRKEKSLLNFLFRGAAYFMKRILKRR